MKPLKKSLPVNPKDFFVPGMLYKFTDSYIKESSEYGEPDDYLVNPKTYEDLEHQPGVEGYPFLVVGVKTRSIQARTIKRYTVHVLYGSDRGMFVFDENILHLDENDFFVDCFVGLT